MVGEHRAVYAYVRYADAAVTAFANPALHVPLTGGDDVVLFETQFQQVLDDETEHDRRAADKGDSVVDFDLDARFLEQRADNTDVAGVTGAGTVDGQVEFRPALLPFLQVIGVHERFRILGAVKNLEVLELVTIGQDIDDGGAQWNQADAAGHDDDVLAVVRFHRKTVAERAAQRKFVAGLILLEGVGADSHLAKREKGLPFRGARRQR